MPLFGAAYAAPNKDITILYWFRSLKTVLNTPVNGKILELFKAFECFSSTFQGKFNFQGLLKTVLYIQVLLKPVWTLYEIKFGDIAVMFKYWYADWQLLIIGAEINRESHMSAHVLLNLLNELRKSDKMRGLPKDFIAFLQHKFN